MKSTKLPNLLAGPILRQTSEESISIWLATSIKLPNLNVKLYYANENKLPVEADRIPSHTTKEFERDQEIQCGDNLFIYLLVLLPGQLPERKGLLGSKGKAKTKIEKRNDKIGGRAGNKNITKFPADTVLAYDLEYGPEKSPKRLVDLEGSESLQSIVYQPWKLPSVVIQPAKKSSSFTALHGSCRKLHGMGLAAVVAGDSQIRTHPGVERPSCFLMGGDQIYADDVSSVLIRHIQKLAVALIGHQERVADITNPGCLDIMSRKNLLFPTFSSTESYNHLMTFGEFAAIYLLSWNGVNGIWPDVFPSAQEIWEDSEPLDDDLKSVTERVTKEVVAVRVARNGSKALRRIMANTPTYMMFDDHDITDDWYLNHKWKTDAHKNERTKRIICNGLMAYWIFQALGNDPHKFNQKSLRNEFETYRRESNKSNPAGEKFIDYKNWGYVTSTSPPIVFVDTRTRRRNPDSTTQIFAKYAIYSIPQIPWLVPKSEDTPEGLAVLMDDTAISYLKKDMTKAMKHDRRLMIYTPTPVIGLQPVEWMMVNSFGVAGLVGEDLANKITKKLSGVNKALMLDLEQFGAHPSSLLSILEVIAGMRPSLVVMLGGDVHFSFSAIGNIDAYGSDFPIAQVTSSALQNEHGKGLKFALNRLDDVNRFLPKIRYTAMARIYSSSHDTIKHVEYEDGPYGTFSSDTVRESFFRSFFSNTHPVLTLSKRFIPSKGYTGNIIHTARNSIGYMTLIDKWLENYQMIQTQAVEDQFLTEPPEADTRDKELHFVERMGAR